MSRPGGGVGTGTGRIKIGDGTTAYTSLPYFLNPDNFISNISTATVTFTATSETNNTTLLSRIVTGAALNTIIASIKNLLYNINNDITYQEITYENWLNLTEQQKENGNYDVTGAPSIGSTASGVTYNNTTSGLSATTVQGAIDEIDSSLITKSYNLVEPSSTLINLRLTKSENTVCLYFRWYGTISNDAMRLGYLPSGEGLDAPITMYQICTGVSANGLQYRGHAMVLIDSGRALIIMPMSDWVNTGDSLIICNMTWQV